MSESSRPFRSTHWFGQKGKDGFIHRSWMRNQGLPPHEEEELVDLEKMAELTGKSILKNASILGDVARLFFNKKI